MMNNAIQPRGSPCARGEDCFVKSLGKNPSLTGFGITEEAARNEA
jgi:hypothetical protein